MRRGNTGELSTFTCGLNVAGSCARLFTTAVLTQDVLNGALQITGFAVNLTLLLQCVGTIRQRMREEAAGEGADAAKLQA